MSKVFVALSGGNPQVFGVYFTREEAEKTAASQTVKAGVVETDIEIPLSSLQVTTLNGIGEAILKGEDCLGSYDGSLTNEEEKYLVRWLEREGANLDGGEDEEKYIVVGFGDHPTRRKEGDRVNWWRVPGSDFETADGAIHGATALDWELEKMTEDGEIVDGRYSSTTFRAVRLADYERITRDRTEWDRLVAEGKDEDTADELDDERIVSQLAETADKLIKEARPLKSENTPLTR